MIEESRKSTPKAVTVRLKKPHTHGSKTYAAGESIEVREDQAKQLKSQDVIE